MRQFELTPGYYEWHLNDKATGETLHNVDSEDVDFLCYDPAGLPLMFFEVVGLCHEELQAANEQYNQGEDYNGIKPTMSSAISWPTNQIMMTRRETP